MFGLCSRNALAVTLSLLATTSSALADSTPPPGQPTHQGLLNQFEIVGESVVSAQQLFLGTPDKVYIVDKTENNKAQISGHPAWASEYSVSSNVGRPMDAITNSFCAGGNVLGNGTWMNVGGNAAITYGGIDLPKDEQATGGPYGAPDGGNSIRLLNPSDGETAKWIMDTPMTTRRWYPTLETLEDGTMIILGGCQFGGYVNDAAQTNPTYEFFPSKGQPVGSPILDRTLPTNLYPLTWLLPSGNILIQSNRATVVLDYKKNTEYPIDDIPDAVRTYPASAGTAMLPLTPSNNWTATVLFCGGSDIANDRWVATWDIASHPTSKSCVTISPDVSGKYVQDDPLPEGRSMGSMILLPDGRIFLLNGAKTGTAGYGNTTWAVGQSFANGPIFQPLMYDPRAPAGSKWSSDGLKPSTIPRMYHSAATLLPDGSVFVSGSNPNADFTTGVPFPTEYRVEKFYPSYFNSRRPQPQGLPSQLSFGGAPFDVTLSSEDLSGSNANVQNATVVVIRPGFSTHAMNMGQRMLQLDSTYTGNADGTGTLHVSQMPPNPAIFVPGPALLFVVVNGVPSIGVQVMIGSGQLGKQDIQPVGPLPASNIVQPNNNTSNSNSNGGKNGKNSNASIRTVVGSSTTSSLAALFTLFFAFASSHILW